MIQAIKELGEQKLKRCIDILKERYKPKKIQRSHF